MLGILLDQGDFLREIGGVGLFECELEGEVARGGGDGVERLSPLVGDHADHLTHLCQLRLLEKLPLLLFDVGDVGDISQKVGDLPSGVADDDGGIVDPLDPTVAGVDTVGIVLEILLLGLDGCFELMRDMRQILFVDTVGVDDLVAQKLLLRVAEYFGDTHRDIIDTPCGVVVPFEEDRFSLVEERQQRLQLQRPLLHARFELLVELSVLLFERFSLIDVAPDDMDDIFVAESDSGQDDLRPEGFTVGAGMDPLELIVPLRHRDRHHLFGLFERSASVGLIFGAQSGGVEVEEGLFGLVAEHPEDRFVALDEFAIFDQEDAVVGFIEEGLEGLFLCLDLSLEPRLPAQDEIKDHDDGDEDKAQQPDRVAVGDERIGQRCGMQGADRKERK